MTDDPRKPRDAGDTGDDLSAGISQTARVLFAAGDVAATWRQLVALAVAGIDGCDHAGVFVVEGNRIIAPAASGRVAAGLDALQQRLGEGPCLDAVANGGVVYCGDLLDPSPWPDWAAAAVQSGIRSSVAVSTGLADRGGALNCYSEHPGAFGAFDRSKALLLGTLGGLALRAAGDKSQAETLAGNLHAALITREVIGQAQGILMERDRISSEQAFDILRRASQHLNVKLRDVAQGVVDTGLNPTRPLPLPRPNRDGERA